MKAPIFIVGLPRSGSTLWSRILRRHPELTVFAEMHYLTLWRKDFRDFLRHEVGDLGHDDEVRRLVDKILAPAGIAALHHGRYYWQQLADLADDGFGDLLFAAVRASDQSLESLFRILVDAPVGCRGFERGVIKFPVHPVHLGKLIEWYPAAKIVHITRDPRAVALSKMNDPGGTGHLTKKYPLLGAPLRLSGKLYAIGQYIQASRVHERYQNADNYQLFKYEDLMMQPRDVVGRLCTFCELEFTEAMLAPDEGEASSVTGVRTSGFDPARASHWRENMSSFEAQLIGRITTASMQRFGYDPSRYQLDP